MLKRELAATAPPDGLSSVRTHCPYCAFQCGIVVSPPRPGRPRGPATGQRAEALSKRVPHVIRGDVDFPLNRGQMCSKGGSAASLLDHKDRITTPLIRNGAGVLTPAGWAEAIETIVTRIRALQASWGPDSIGCLGSGALTNEKAYLLGKFARLALRTAQIDYNGRYCMASAAAAQNRAFGVDRGLPFPVSDIGSTKLLVLWGSNCAETMPPIMQWIEDQREQGLSIVVDPRRTETARLAKMHIQPRPGSDLALANGLLYLVIERGLIDRDYIEARTLGFEAVERKVREFSPARVERLTGVPAAQLERFVHLIAESESSMILSGRGAEQQSKGSDTVSALINLMLALGKVGKPYSGYGCITGQGNGQGGREHGQKADQLPGYRLIEDPEDRDAIARHWGIDPSELPAKGRSQFEMLDSIGRRDAIHGLLVFGSNVAVASPDLTSVIRKLSQLQLLVVADSFVNETAQQAHVVLPVTQWVEETGTMTNLEGRVVLRRRVCSPPPDIRSDLQVICDLAAGLGYADRFPSAEPRAIFEELRTVTRGAKADYSGMTYERLDAEKGLYWPCPDEEHPGTPRLFSERFNTADGKARFVVVDHRPAGEEPDARYPLYFTTGRYKEHYNSGAQTRRVDALNKVRTEPYVEIHPSLAAKLGVEEDDLVVIESRRGSVRFRVAITTEIRADTVFAPFHWGGRQAANALTNPALDPHSRMPEFKVCAVRVAAARDLERPTQGKLTPSMR